MITAHTVYAFCSGNAGGNPAGVVLDAERISESRRLEIARVMNFSETAFVSPSEKAAYKIDFYTPTKRIADCGHATVATFALLKSVNPSMTESSKEILGGHVRKILFDGSQVFMEQPLAQVEAISMSELPLEHLFSKHSGVVGGSISRHDVGFLNLEVQTDHDLKVLTPNFHAITQFSNEQDLVGITAYCDWGKDGIAARSRMFAPAYGVNEECATGMATGCLASQFIHQGKGNEFTIEQGRHMSPSSPSLIYAHLNNEEETVMVGGHARTAPNENRGFDF